MILILNLFMAEKYPDMLIGAGTVLTIEQVDRAVGAGTKFIVSPGFDPEIVDYCIVKNILKKRLNLSGDKKMNLNLKDK